MSNFIKEISVEKAEGLVGSSYQTLDYDPSPMIRKPVSTGFFEAFFNVKPTYIQDTIHQKRIVNQPGLQLPEPKAYHELKGALAKKSGKKENLNVGSFGTGWNVQVTDVKSRINPSTMQKYTIAELMAEMSTAAAQTWSNLRNTATFQLLTADTNYGGTHASHSPYNYYTLFEGGSRPAATSLQLDSSPAGGHEALVRAQVNLLQEDMMKQLDSVPSNARFTWLCGSTFFSKRRVIEENAGLARPLTYGVDMASDLQPYMVIGGFRHAYFDSRDGCRYIEVNDSVASGSKIDTNTAYLVCEGIDYFESVFSPAQTLSNIENVAQREYAWTTSHERNGIIRVEESNVLYVSNYPKLIRVATV